MTFVHESGDFDALLQIVAKQRELRPGLVEKDYWVTHTLWALHRQGLEVWFKGGTSLSKGFELIQRFSEDLDLKIEAGKAAALPFVANWKSEGKKATAKREAYFKALEQQIRVPGADVRLDMSVDESARNAHFHVLYPGRHLESLSADMHPFVLLEIGNARVTPFVPRDMSSFVHEYLAQESLAADFEANQPRGVRCVHPLVTLLEKLDALMKRLPREDCAPATFVRHFEDAAHIIAASFPLPEPYRAARSLAEEMLGANQIKQLPAATHAAFQPDEGERWNAVRKAHQAISPMFWGPRLPIEDSCARIRGWIATALAA